MTEKGGFDNSSQHNPEGTKQRKGDKTPPHILKKAEGNSSNTENSDLHNTEDTIYNLGGITNDLSRALEMQGIFTPGDTKRLKELADAATRKLEEGQTDAGDRQNETEFSTPSEKTSSIGRVYEAAYRLMTNARHLMPPIIKF